MPDLAGARKHEQAFSPIYIGTINGGVLALELGSLGDVTGIPATDAAHVLVCAAGPGCR